jgi:hypothetical protein
VARLLVIVIVVLTLTGLAWGRSLENRRLPERDFRAWDTVPHDEPENAIYQIWRKPLEVPTKGVKAEVLFAYQVTEMQTPGEARGEAKDALDKKKYDRYIARGYTVSASPWKVREQAVMLFTVRGEGQAEKDGMAHRADVYVMAFAIEDYLIRAEYRQVFTAKALEDADKAVKHVTAAQAEELFTRVLVAWDRVKGVLPPPEPPATETPTPPPPTEVTPTPPPPADAKIPEPTWRTADGNFALALPDGVKVKSEKGTYYFDGVAGATIRLYPADTYEKDTELPGLLKAIADGLNEISAGGFAAKNVTLDGAPALEVHYRNAQQHAMHEWFVGKAGRLWHLEVDCDTADAPVPAPVAAMMKSVRVK